MEPRFFQTGEPEPHRRRAQAILADHPAIAGLIGTNPATFAIILAGVVIQLALARQLASGPWWLLGLAALTVGAVIAHAQWVMIHECAHRRVFRARLANRLAGMVANTVLVVPSSASFEKYHLRHHVHQGVPSLDADLPSAWEVRLFASSRVGRALWLAIFALVVALRPARMPAVPLWDRWLVLNCVVVFGTDALVLWLWGPSALLYLLASLALGLGLHPLGARWVQEHYTDDAGQETFSYYGPWRFVQFNVGCHNEHHDFPGIPWNRLHRLRRIAPEHYATLRNVPSLTALLAAFVWHGTPAMTGRILRAGTRGSPPPQAGSSLDIA